ncbi:uncharacterized protein VTP21DRAFT_3089 [Calcarisporiella thermophila]|uniref:uncharacterized protein n=1 Tax=Calcarisporiella thermophila TaxID=911321 RepID=UPI003744579E
MKHPTLPSAIGPLSLHTEYEPKLSLSPLSPSASPPSPATPSISSTCSSLENDRLSPESLSLNFTPVVLLDTDPPRASPLLGSECRPAAPGRPGKGFAILRLL